MTRFMILLTKEAAPSSVVLWCPTIIVSAKPKIIIPN